MKTTAGLLAVLMIGTSVSAFAEKVYRWVDENGQTHFSSLPPEGNNKKAKEYRLKVSPASAEVEGYKINSRSQENTEKKDDEVIATKASVSKEEADAACKQAKEYKATLATNYSRRFKQDDGSFRPLTDEERSAEMKKANDLISQYCSGK